MEFPRDSDRHHEHHPHYRRREERTESSHHYETRIPPVNKSEQYPYQDNSDHYNRHPPFNRPTIGHERYGFDSPYRPSFEPEPDYPTVRHVSHELNEDYRGGHGKPFSSVTHHIHYGEIEPDYPTIQHVSHKLNEDYGEGHENPFSSASHHIHHGGMDVSQKKIVKVYCLAGTNYYLSIRNGTVILATADPNDVFQHWIMDEKYSTRVKDEEGFPCFALVNKATGQALKHSIGATYPIQLIPYNPDVLDESVLWTQSRDVGQNFRFIRMVNNIRLNLDAFHGDKEHGVHDGTALVLWELNHGDNQKWKIVPY